MNIIKYFESVKDEGTFCQSASWIEKTQAETKPSSFFHFEQKINLKGRRGNFDILIVMSCTSPVSTNWQTSGLLDACDAFAPKLNNIIS